MFVRTKKRNNTEKKAVQIVKSYRNKGKVKQKVMQTIGYAFDQDTLDKLVNIAEQIKIRLELEEQPSLFPPEKLIKHSKNNLNNLDLPSKNLYLNLANAREDKTVITGIHQVYGYIYDLLGFDNAFTTKNRYYLGIIKDIVLARLANPVSKRGTVEMLKKDFSLELDLSKVYRAMDRLDDYTMSKIQKISSEATQIILGRRIKIAFYDCTTLYFESFKSDELKKLGYSKDNKQNQPQVLLSLLITEEGLPLGYNVYPGNVYEGNTLVDSLDKLQKDYNLEEITIVADSGLLSRKNISEIKKRGYKYVLGCRLRSLTQSKQKEILEGISKVRLTKESTGNSNYTIYESRSIKGERLIVKYSGTLAEKHKKDREKYVSQLQEKLNKSKSPKNFMSNYGYKKYLCYNGSNDKLDLNKEKLSLEEAWDGISGIITNVEKRSGENLIDCYRELWQIESCFRIQKHDLKIRPVFHWTPRRVKSHINICYQAFCCQQYLRYRLRLSKIEMSCEEIRKILLSMKQTIIRDISTSKLYAIPSPLHEKASKIYKTMGKKYSAVPYELPSD